MGNLVLLSLALLAQLVAAHDQVCLEGELRLKIETTESGNNVTSIQYCLNNTWRNICDHRRWNRESARVACRQLGYSDENPSLSSFPDEKNLSTTIRPRRNCNGHENRLQECGVVMVSQCKELVSLKCQPGCVAGEVRLMNGSNSNEGRVEVCLDGQWGTVCNKSQEGIAEAICSHLGHPAGAMIKNTFSPRSLPISSCAVQNVNSLSCTQITDTSCDHSMDLGVVCNTYKQLYEELLLNITNSTTDLSGVCHSYKQQYIELQANCSNTTATPPSTSAEEVMHAALSSETMTETTHDKISKTTPAATKTSYSTKGAISTTRAHKITKASETVPGATPILTTSGTTQEATTIITAMAVALGVLMLLLFGMAITALVIICKKFKSLSKRITDGTTFKRSTKPVPNILFEKQLYTLSSLTTHVAENPAYESSKGDQGDEWNPYEAVC